MTHDQAVILTHSIPKSLRHVVSFWRHSHDNIFTTFTYLPYFPVMPILCFNDASTWINYLPMKRSWVSSIFLCICQANSSRSVDLFGDEHMLQYGSFLRRDFTALSSIPRLCNLVSQYTFTLDDEYRLVQFIRLQSDYDRNPCWHDYTEDDLAYTPTPDDVTPFAFPLG